MDRACEVYRYETPFMMDGGREGAEAWGVKVALIFLKYF